MLTNLDVKKEPLDSLGNIDSAQVCLSDPHKDYGDPKLRRRLTVRRRRGKPGGRWRQE